MARTPLEVREAVPADASALIDLWRLCVAGDPATAGDVGPSLVVWHEPSVGEATEALRLLEADDRRRLCVATVGERVVGAIHVELATTTPLHLSSTVVVSELHVHPSFRRRGIASSLMGVAVEWAEAAGSGLVYAWAPSASRDAHRFLTRIGFGQYATVRAARLRVLQARAAARASGRGTGRLIAVRRSLRRAHDGLARTGRD
ncbi:GNAT family N-acetyltransferase [Mumia quercus]|uniref:GNAT family N-acetyltransferase n=1 Tax=Mumia quercus TaxID=2976125 RepID=UPI0021CE8BD4|nr:GNAT family N-acetyltransferase [Mumia quercus]